MVRFKNRWLLVEFIPATATTASSAPVRTSDQAISGKDVSNALKQSVLGEVGSSLAGTFFSPFFFRKSSTRLASAQSNPFHQRHTFVSYVSREEWQRTRPRRRLCSRTVSEITTGTRSCRM
ncbi:hypothetical protein V8E53_006284 [Lactarius tabidus]